MASQLHADCLGEIFEYLRGDEVTLRSCLLVNHLWCEGSVRILWARIQNYNTLVACLPSESKEILFKSGIIVSTPTSKPLLFDYVKFIKILSMKEIYITLSYFSDNKDILIKQVFKMLMMRTSLKGLNLYLFS